MTKYWNLTLENRKLNVERLQKEIENLKMERASKSSELQQKLFKQYQYTNWSNI